MRIWVINPYDDIPGEGAKQRFWTLCETLAARGHEVTWWSSSWSHRRKAPRSLAAEKDPELGSVRLRLINAPPYESNVSLARLKNHRVFAEKLQQAGEALLADEPPRLVVFSWPPMDVGQVALRWREQCECRVVLDVMDAWPDNFLILAPSVPGAKQVLRAALEPWMANSRKVCQGVDAVSAQSHAFAHWARERQAPEPIHVCYLGAATSSVGPIQRHTSGPLRLLYLGAMGRVYDLATLINAMAKLRDGGVDVHLDLAGEGEQLDSLRDQAQRLGLAESVRFHGYVTGEALRDLLHQSHVGVIPMLPESRVAAPYKAGEYLGAGLPIVNSLPGELEDLLSQRQCGVQYQVGDSESLALAITQYVTDRERLARESRHATALYTEQFDRATTYARWAEWLENCAA